MDVDGLTPFCGARVEFPLKIFPESASLYFQTRQNLGAWPVQSQVQWRAADCVISLSQPVWEVTYSKMSLLSCLWIVTIFTEMSEQRVKVDRFEIWICLFQYFQWLVAIDSRLTLHHQSAAATSAREAASFPNWLAPGRGEVFPTVVVLCQQSQPTNRDWKGMWWCATRASLHQKRSGYPASPHHGSSIFSSHSKFQMLASSDISLSITDSPLGAAPVARACKG